MPRRGPALLDRRQVDFEYDGEMAADVALDPDLMALYPFCRLSGPANVLIMPALHAANIARQAAAAAGRRHGDRPAADRFGQAGAGRPDGRFRVRHRQRGGAGGARTRSVVISGSPPPIAAEGFSRFHINVL